MEIIPDKRKLVGLVEQAHEGKLCLPNFQRDFVWPRDQVADLLRSILRRYFVGSLLLLRCDPQKPPFAPVFLRGAKPLYQQARPEHLVLDGQQRLTSLIYALTAPDYPLKDSSQRRWFYVDLDLLRAEPDNHEIVFDCSKRELDGLDEVEAQYKRRVLPCTRLLRSGDFMNWRDGLDDWLRDHDAEEHQRFRKEWRDGATKAINDFQTFEVPLVELPRVDDGDTDAIGRVCAIFEKLNSTGIELSVYDLLTARLYRSGIKIHDLWEHACKENTRLATWSEGKADTNKFGVLVIRTLAVLRGLDPKPRILIDLKPEGFERDWERSTRAMDRALQIATDIGQDGFGVFDRKWLPGFGLLPVLAALRTEIEERKLGEGPRADLRRWYWSNVFLERYSSAIESKSRKDYSELLAHWVEDKPEPAVFAEARARIGASGFSVADSASFASSVYSGIFSLLAIAGGRDWRRGESIQLQDLEDHHIFPRAYLRRHGISNKNEVNSIVNRTLISDETNGKIKDKAPAEYIASPEISPSGATEALLAPHFISPTGLIVLKSATEGLSKEAAAKKYEEFRKNREATIIAKIRDVCGVPSPDRK
ncbi:MAG: DUF262 domain-containing protein [Planctomycetes bacterium]|nr:DUF262 domain-containing protein [Planctomycetota bacterium]